MVFSGAAGISALGVATKGAAATCNACASELSGGMTALAATAPTATAVLDGMKERSV